MFNTLLCFIALYVPFPANPANPVHTVKEKSYFQIDVEADQGVLVGLFVIQDDGKTRIPCGQAVAVEGECSSITILVEFAQGGERGQFLFRVELQPGMVNEITLCLKQNRPVAYT